MTKSIREVIESPLPQGTREGINYRFDYSDLGTPTNPTAKAFEIGSSLTDVTATKLTGVATISGDGILAPKLSGLEAGHAYLLYVEGTINGNVFGKYARIIGELP